MDNKIKTLLEKLNLSEKCKSCFNDSKLEKASPYGGAFLRAYTLTIYYAYARDKTNSEKVIKNV